ncbi:MAG: GEVED domain-containing protein, partial [Campylobacterota bacterium]|nr:GEVED domain-containing protein [Campylobacterota bacterium]
MMKDMTIYRKFYMLSALLIGLILFPSMLQADPFPPDNDSNATGMHYEPVAWPTESEWKPYTRFNNSLEDPRTQDPSNGGTSPQNYVNIASSCLDETLPSIYYFLRQGATPEDDVIMFRWRVEQIANTYATGPSAGSAGATDPWGSALWTVFFDLDGDGYRDIAAHIDGSSGTPGEDIDRIFGIYGNVPTQSIAAEDDPNIHVIGHNPAGFVNSGSSTLYNYHNTNTPDTSWPNGSSETVWDYGTTRSTEVSTNPCNEYYIDYQIPVALLDASAFGGPTLTRDTPISMIFCTSNSLNNPLQKDCAINAAWTSDTEDPAPFGDYVSFDRNESYQQPIVDDLTGSGCNPVALTAKVKDSLAVVNGVVVRSVQSVDFYVYRDADGDGEANDGDTWTHAVSAVPVDFTTWVADWASEELFAGQYLIGVQVKDNRTLVDDNMPESNTTNVTFSYLTQAEVDALPGKPVDETWWANPEITGVKDIALAVNSCGVTPTLVKDVNDSNPTVGDTVTFGLTFTNPASADNLEVNLTQLQDILPTGFSYHGNLGGTLAASVTTTSNIGDQGTIIWNVNGGGITVPTDTNVTLTFEANVSDVTGVYNNVATSDSSFGVVRSNIVPINVGAPLLNIAIEANKVLYAEGETVNYTVTYGNDSSVSTTNTVVEVNLTALGFSSIGNISDGGVLSGEVITWTIGDLPTGSSGNIFTFDANVSDPFNTINNPIVAPATINSNETNLQTATATILVDVPTPSLVISKDANVSFVTPANNEQVEYNITIANTGTGAATDVNITDVVPTGFTFVSAPAVNPNPAGTLSGGTVTWAIGSLDVNSSTSVTLILQVDNPNTDTSSTNTAVAVASNMSGTREANVTIGIFNVIGGGTCNDLANLYDPSIYVDTSDNTLSTTAVATVDYDKNTATTFDIYLAPDLNDTTVYQGFSFANDLIGAGETFTTATLYFTSYSSKIDGSGQIDIYADGSLFTTQAITTSSTGNNVPSVLEVDLSGLTATQLNNLEFNATAFSSDKNKDFHTDYVKLCVLKETSPFLTLQYKVDKLNANVDDNLTYTVTYGNSGGADANGTTITASVPEGLESIVPANGGIYDAGTGLITWSDLNITSGLTDTLTFTADINNSFTGSTLPSTATLEHTPSTTSLSADVVTQLEGIVEGGTPDIRLELSADKTALIPGDIVTYSLKVINVGDGSALDLNISEAIPQLLDASSLTWFKYVTGSMTGGDTNLTESATLLEWGIDSLGVGQFETLTFKMEVNATGVPSGLTVIDDNATATASNVVGTAQSNVVTVTINTNPNLAITKSVSNPNAVPGEVVTYTINVKNIGTGDANGTTMSDPIPNNMSFEGNASTITTTQGTANFDGVRNEVIVTLGTLGAGEDANITFQAKVSALPAGSTTITNTAFTAASNAATRSDTADIISVADVNLTVDISGPTSGGYPSTTISQNSSSITIGVENTSSFIPGQVIKIDGTVYTIVTIGGNSLDLNDTVTVTEGTEVIGSVTYSVRYNNVGDADANDTNLSVDMGGLDFYSATGNSTFDGTSVKWDLNTSVVVGTTGTFKIVAFPPNVGSFTLDAEIVSDATADNLEDNNRDTITTIFGGITAVKTTSTPVVTQPSSGTVNVNYKIVITNSLNKIINDVNVTDTLPSGFTYLSTSTGQTVDASDTSRPIWSGIDVPAEGNATIEFIATINANTAATTHQNAIDTQTAEANTSIIQYDEISSTGEDVTVLASTDGVVTGYVFLDSNKDGNYTNTDRGFEGIAVTITSDTNASLFYTVSTNADGYFSRVVGEGNWTVSYTPITTLTTDYEFTIGSNPTSYEVLGGATVVDYNGYEEPTILSVTSDTVTEGQDLNHTVTIDGNVSVAKTYSFSLEDNTTTEGDDYSLASMTFTNGVTYDSGTGLITVPANVTSFNVIVPTIDDADPESTEWYDLTIGGVSATGTILDNDTAVGDIDYGDLPVSYGTLLANDAPRHTIGTGDIYLGSTLPDAESDGQPSDDAKADDNGSNPNEEDGIVFLNPMVEGEDSNLTVTASAQCDTSTCNFSMWIDFNQDGDFEDAGEQIFADSVIGAGDTNLTYSVPSGTDTSKPMYAMARLSTDAGLGTTGLATDGEVETYYIDSP